MKKVILKSKLEIDKNYYIPSIMYGKGEKNIKFYLKNKIYKYIRKFNIYNIYISKKKFENFFIKNIQFDISGINILNIDFQKLRNNTIISLPIKVINIYKINFLLLMKEIKLIIKKIDLISDNVFYIKLKKKGNIHISDLKINEKYDFPIFIKENNPIILKTI
ncbi:hypothetical protein [Candidatus Vidania fulgoroideorum]